MIGRTANVVGATSLVPVPTGTNAGVPASTGKSTTYPAQVYMKVIPMSVTWTLGAGLGSIVPTILSDSTRVPNSSSYLKLPKGSWKIGAEIVVKVSYPPESETGLSINLNFSNEGKYVASTDTIEIPLNKVTPPQQVLNLEGPYEGTTILVINVGPYVARTVVEIIKGAIVVSPVS